MLKKNSPVEMVLPFAERKRLADFFAILIAVNKRVRAKKAHAKKAQEPKLKLKDKKARKIAGLVFFINYFTFTRGLSLQQLLGSNTYDRHNSFSIKQGYVYH
jgi:hypothetical protein